MQSSLYWVVISFKKRNFLTFFVKNDPFFHRISPHFEDLQSFVQQIIDQIVAEQGPISLLVLFKSYICILALLKHQ